MNNPVQVFEKIRDNFILYLETAFGTRFPDFEDERRELMKRDKVFARSPWVEPLPTYKPSGITVEGIQRLPNLNTEELEIFKRIVLAGMFGDNELYVHQHEMLTTAMNGNHCVITSGTGSGKTESFLLPLFAYLSKEMNNWKNHPNHVNNTNWWSEKGYGPEKMINKLGRLSENVKQRPDVQRPAAVRALVLYPMNALVEDQLTRLRKALDSDDAREIFSIYNHNRIYFGRYNGNTPVSGKLLPSDGSKGENSKKNKYIIDKLKKEIKDIETNIQKVSAYLDRNPDNKSEEEKKELLANFQRLDGAEMRTRFDMQETPPDILITNFSMLSIMLMREIDNPILEKTKEWLTCNTEFDEGMGLEEVEAEKKNRIFHIIIDELHLYRGGSGTETALLIRLLLDRLGLAPDSDQLRILASSASLEGEDGQLFLKSFFGTEKKEIKIISGTEITPQGKNISLDVQKYEKLGARIPAIEERFSLLNQPTLRDLDNIINDVIEMPDADIIASLSKDQENIKYTLYDAFKRYDHRVRAIPAFRNGEFEYPENIISVAEALFNADHAANSTAVKGFLFALNIFERYKLKNTFSRLRFHLFFRNIGGIWAELRSDQEMVGKIDQMPVVNLMTTPLLISNGKRTLELIYCENCGAIAYAGNRIDVMDLNGTSYITELLPLSSDVEGVPEMSSATIVEKRRYKDYSVFYPGDFSGEMVQPEYRIPNGGKDDYSAQWEVAWINVRTGKISISDPNNSDEFKKGLWYRVKNEYQTDIKYLTLETSKTKSIPALPCSCPQCKADYSKPAPKKKKFSPYRGFRTGFGKLSQVLTKELFEELPSGKNTKKLVAFSDSREDAAKLAKNIEEEHYSSLVREVLIHKLTDELQFDNDVLIALETKNRDEISRLHDRNSTRVSEIHNIFSFADMGIGNSEHELENLRNNIKPISDFINIIIRNFLEHGMNPAGPSKSLQTVCEQNGNYDKYVGWQEAFDFNELTFKQGYYYKKYENGYYKNIDVGDHFKRKIEENLSGFIFGKLFYSFEASGLGHVTITKKVDDAASKLDLTPTLLKEICNSFIRIWGDRYKHNRTEFDSAPYGSFTDIPENRRERKYIKSVAGRLKKDEHTLGNTVFHIAQGDSHQGQVEINHLHVKLANRNAHFYECKQCSAIHLHGSAGICVFCQSELSTQPSIETVETLWAKSYLTSNLLGKYNPFRLHTEELSGQTDDQLTRQREFKNIFINNDDEKTKSIDVLCVTTTLEVGVDIGSLQAILLANMPPQRFNYQQRVGRTGRRGQMYSYALTIARGRNHDEYYFENPASITGDKPPQPFLSLGQVQIFKRVLAKSILREAFKELNEVQGSVHGEFGSISKFVDENQVRLKKYLVDNIDNSVKDKFDALNNGIYVNGILNPYLYEEFKPWILNLPDLIRTKIDGSTLLDMDLSEFLAENGILPLQGMPTRVRNLIHGFNKISKGNSDKKEKQYTATTIDRDLGIAIFDFAPGSQKTKDKGVIQSIGFTPDITGIRYNYATEKYEPITKHSDAFISRIWMRQDEQTKKIETHKFSADLPDLGKPVDEAGFNVFLGATPAAFRTDLNYPKDSNEDFDINFSKPLTFAESSDQIPQHVGNSSIRYASQEQTWKINNNGGLENQFTGTYYNSKVKGAVFPRQWILNSLSSSLGDKARPEDGAKEETLSLVSGKVTEVFRLEPKDLPLVIEINPFSSDKFKASSSKGAFYSAAFLLQRTLAAKLDIDPEEIEIAAIESLILPERDGIDDRKSASIVLTDELPNGSGFVKQLYDNFGYYLRRCTNPDNNPEEKYNYNILQNRACLDASYQDLMNYRNMSFHPLLDWRLAVGLLRLLSDDNYTSGLAAHDYNFPEMLDWKDFVADLLDKFQRSFSDEVKKEKFGELPGFSFMRDFKVIIVHPFWNVTTHQPQQSILTDAIEAAGIDNLYFVDTFNLHRRPSWCYEQLIKKIEANQ